MTKNNESPFIIRHITTREYNPNYGDHRVCVCGYPYHAHFSMNDELSLESPQQGSCDRTGCTEFLERDNLVNAVKDLLAYIEDTTCKHEDTYRGGAIWEICGDCGMRWADDHGGKPPFTYPAPVARLQELIKEL